LAGARDPTPKLDFLFLRLLLPPLLFCWSFLVPIAASEEDEEEEEEEGASAAAAVVALF